MYSQRAYRGVRYEATGDEGPDMARERPWPVEHVVYQRLDLLKDKGRKTPTPRIKPVQFRAGGVRPRDDVDVVNFSAMAPTLPAPGGSGTSTSYRYFAHIHILRPEQS